MHLVILIKISVTPIIFSYEIRNFDIVASLKYLVLTNSTVMMIVIMNNRYNYHLMLI